MTDKQKLAVKRIFDFEKLCEIMANGNTKPNYIEVAEYVNSEIKRNVKEFAEKVRPDLASNLDKELVNIQKYSYQDGIYFARAMMRDKIDEEIKKMEGKA